MHDVELRIQPPGLSQSIELSQKNKSLFARSSDQLLSYVITDEKQTTLHCQQIEASPLRADQHLILLMSLMEMLFSHRPELQSIIIAKPECELDALYVQAYVHRNGNDWQFDRSTFYQCPLLWHREPAYLCRAERWQRTQDRLHPIRPKPAPGCIYRRYLPELKEEISFDLLNFDEHLDIFTEWQNQARVAAFWELNQSREELKSYLQKLNDDPHAIPVIVNFNAITVGYFEIYWTMEDRLGPHYDAEAYDRGFHFLIGNRRFLGPKYTAQILKAATHMIFLDDVRTRRIMGEPRFDNQMLLRYLQIFPAWEKLCEFDFPHKRAALLACHRQRFFEGGFL
ncbi:MAG: GNAT family N-acetyltransferase [Oligoflexus sp.]